MQFQKVSGKNLLDETDGRPTWEKEHVFDNFKGKKLQKTNKEVVLSSKHSQHSRSTARIQEPLEPIDISELRVLENELAEQKI